MRKLFLIPVAAAFAAAIASPAMAAEGRAEARGGVFAAPGYTQGIAGIAIGSDFDLSDTLFAGVEASADKILDGGTRVMFGASGRVGVKAGESTRVYAIGGYTTKACGACDGSWHVGAGAEQDLGGPIYGKVEWRHYFPENGGSQSNAYLVGIGTRF